MATYKELKAQAEALLQQAESARRAEIATVVAEIQARMKEYGITLADLKGGAKKTKTRGMVAAKIPPSGDRRVVSTPLTQLRTVAAKIPPSGDRRVMVGPWSRAQVAGG